MSEKTTTEMIEVMKAYEEGKKIECKLKFESEKDWKVVKTPYWDWVRSDYRVKEEPKYRPYKDIKEMITDFCKRFRYTYQKSDSLPFIWVKGRGGTERLITGYDISDNTISIVGWITLKNLFKDYTYLDGSFCGIKEY